MAEVALPIQMYRGAQAGLWLTLSTHDSVLEELHARETTKGSRHTEGFLVGISYLWFGDVCLAMSAGSRVFVRLDNVGR